MVPLYTMEDYSPSRSNYNMSHWIGNSSSTTLIAAVQKPELNSRKEVSIRTFLLLHSNCFIYGELSLLYVSHAPIATIVHRSEHALISPKHHYYGYPQPYLISFYPNTPCEWDSKLNQWPENEEVNRMLLPIYSYHLFPDILIGTIHRH